MDGNKSDSGRGLRNRKGLLAFDGMAFGAEGSESPGRYFQADAADRVGEFRRFQVFRSYFGTEDRLWPRLPDLLREMRKYVDPPPPWRHQKDPKRRYPDRAGILERLAKAPFLQAFHLNLFFMNDSGIENSQLPTLPNASRTKTPKCSWLD